MHVSIRLALALVPACVLLFSTGCGPKKWEDKTVKLEVGEIHKVFFDAPLVDKATVIIRSPGGPVNAHLVLDVNVSDAEKLIKDNKTPKDVLAGAEKIEEKSFEIGPGKKPFTLILWGAKKDCTVLVIASGK